MTILTTDIKLLESERMSDAANGGGRKTSNVIVDGEPGNIFPKVSRLDSVYGRVNLRKIFGAVVTANLDTYAGAHAIITDAPDNPLIHAALFSTGSDYDTRTAARDFIESYVVAGPETRMVLYGRQLAGSQGILAYQRPEESLPEIGDVYCLSKETGGVTEYQQFVRVTDVSSTVNTFTEVIQSTVYEFQMRVVDIKIGARLRFEFSGPSAPSRLSNVARSALVRATTVADAARYYGIQKTVLAAAMDELTIKVASVYTPIVPTTQREIALSNVQTLGANFYQGAAAVESIYSLGNIPSLEFRRIMPRAIKPGSVTIYNATAQVSHDDGQGNLVGGVGIAKITGKVDYETGALDIVSNYFGGSNYINYIPAAYVGQAARTEEVEITLANRGTVYSQILNPLPAPRSVIVDYRALGKWYRLRDNGVGELSGDDPAYGIGTVNYVTGALVITLGALPDVDSSLITSWGSPVDYTIRAGATSDAGTNYSQRFTLTDLPVQPGTLSIAFVSDATAPFDTTLTCTANSAGVISGNGVTGTVDHQTGDVALNFSTYIPNPNSNITASYSQLVATAPGTDLTVTGTYSWGAAFTMDGAPLSANSFRGVLNLNGWWGSPGGPVVVVDDGSGTLVVRGGQVLGAGSATFVEARVAGDTTVGTINYTTGLVSPTAASVPVAYKAYNAGAGTWFDASTTATIASGVNVVFKSTASASAAATSDVFNTATTPLYVDLTRTSADRVVPGSVLFTITGGSVTKQFFDRNGVIYTDLDAATGAALACGSIDYVRGRVSLTGAYAPGAAVNTLAVQACLTIFGQFSAVDAFFRTAGSPLRPGSVYVQATALDGSLISGTADESGNITGPKMRGEVVQDMGVVRVEFGETISSVWTPIEVAPNTLRYSAVVLSNLPLNADILGLDPVRLPSDGRVPVFRPADVVVIHNTKSFALPNPAVAGATYSAGRTDLSDLWLVDATGVKVPTSKFVPNLAAGSVTMAADLSLAGFTQPLVARHRIEQMQLLSDVQINGTLGLTAPLSRDFDDDDTYVSSALLFGDLNAEVPVFFDQATWLGTWIDTLGGSSATAQYNDIGYPVEVLNDGAVTDRWRLNFLTGNPSSGVATFQVISENLGVIATGNTGADCAPVDALTGKPYFVIRAGGWGLGWASGNQVRFNTRAAGRPIQIARTVLPGASLSGDVFSLALRGDVDA